jgi:hypothetical protein
MEPKLIEPLLAELGSAGTDSTETRRALAGNRN